MVLEEIRKIFKKNAKSTLSVEHAIYKRLPVCNWRTSTFSVFLPKLEVSGTQHNFKVSNNIYFHNLEPCFGVKFPNTRRNQHKIVKSCWSTLDSIAKIKFVNVITKNKNLRKNQLFVFFFFVIYFSMQFW